MKTGLLAFSVFLLTSLAFGQQQLIKSVGNTAKEKANAQDFNTTRNNKERGNLMDNKRSNQAAPAAVPPPAPAMESEAPAPAEPSGEYQSAYTFTSSALYKMENLKKSSGVQEVDYSFADQSVKMEFKEQKLAFITDSKNGVVITLDDQDKSAMVMSLKAMEMAAKQQQQTNEEGRPPVKVTKTGRTKILLGYTCEETLVESDHKKTEVWNTTEAGINAGTTFEKMMQRTWGQFPDEAFSGAGMLMEMTAYDLEGKPDIKMSVVSISKEPKVVNIGAYKITKM